MNIPSSQSRVKPAQFSRRRVVIPFQDINATASPMPRNFHYPPILSLISAPRLASYDTTFSPSTDSELYGIYIWAQHVVGALYPILQNIEISLRNAIDAEARQRFGEFYWRLPQFNTPQTIDFSNNLRKAESKLNAEWRTREHRRRGLISGTSAWSHDKIVAATDFSTWEYVLRDDFSTQDRTQEPYCLWPLSMSKIFRQYHAIDPSNLACNKKLHGCVDLWRVAIWLI